MDTLLGLMDTSLGFRDTLGMAEDELLTLLGDGLGRAETLVGTALIVAAPVGERLELAVGAAVGNALGWLEDEPDPAVSVGDDVGTADDVFIIGVGAVVEAFTTGESVVTGATLGPAVSTATGGAVTGVTMGDSVVVSVVTTSRPQTTNRH
jgi:hypothetical protein